MNNKYQCCFCGNTIENDGLGITGLIVVLNWDKGRTDQQEQQLFCHMDCLKERMNPQIPLYIADVID